MTVRGTLARATAGGPEFRVLADRIIVEAEGERSLSKIVQGQQPDTRDILDESPVGADVMSDVERRLRELNFSVKQLNNTGILVAEADNVDNVLQSIAEHRGKFSESTIRKVKNVRSRAKNSEGDSILGGFEGGPFDFSASEDSFEAELRSQLSNLSLQNPVTDAVKELEGVANAELDFTRNTPGPRNLNLDVLSEARTVTGEEEKKGKPDVGDAIKKFGVPKAWSITRGEGVVVADFDTSFCPKYLKSDRVIDTFSGPDVESAWSAPEEGHGTMTAYSAAGNKEESGLPYNGVAPEADLLLARVSNKGGSLKYVAEAWDWLVGHIKRLDRPVVSNHSYGVPLCSAREMDLCTNTTTKLATAVNNRSDHQAFYAAGNEALYCGHRLAGMTNGINGINSDPSSVTIAAFRYDLKDAQNYSSHGFGTCNSVDQNPKPDVGCLLPDIVPYGCKEKDMSMGQGGSGGGTSEATPLTCGTAALMASEITRAKQAELEELLEGTAKRVRPTQINVVRNHDARFGHGQIQADAAVAQAAILEPESPPNAAFTYEPQNPAAGQTVNFDGSAATDPDENIESYSWDFGDGATAQGQTASHTYDSPGDYTVTLTVTDTAGFTDTEQARVNVSAEESEGSEQQQQASSGLIG